MHYQLFSSLDWGTFIALYSLPSSGPDLMNPSLWTFELIITVWGQWAQLNLYCAAPSWFSMHGAFPLALRGKSTQWEPIRWDNNTNPAQSLAHWNQMNKNQLPNSMRFPSCYTNQNKDRSSMGFPHATPTAIKSKQNNMKAWCKMDDRWMQDGCETKMVDRWDECEVTWSDMNMKWIWNKLMTMKHDYNQHTDPNQLNQQPTGSRDQVSS